MRLIGKQESSSNNLGDHVALQRALEHLALGLDAITTPVDVILRDDDVTDDLTTLNLLLEIAEKHQVPLHLAVIPAQMTQKGAEQLGEYCFQHPDLVELGQHGLAHTNYGSEKRPYEFGSKRTFEQQYNDISQGQYRLDMLFGNQCVPVFTPPFYGFNRQTLQAVDSLGFKAFSGGPTRPFERRHYKFREVSVNTDPIASYKPYITYKSPDRLVSEMLRTVSSIGYLGIIIHHNLFPSATYYILDQLLAVLTNASNVRFHHLSQYARIRGENPQRWSPKLAALRFRLLLADQQQIDSDTSAASTTAKSEHTSESFEPLPCNICGGEAHRLIVQQQDLLLGDPPLFNMWGCLGCGILYQHPQPPVNATSAYYPINYPVYTRPVDQEHWARRLARRYGLNKRIQIVTQQLQSGRLLDVGCATGDFLGELLRRHPNWTAVGLEPVKVAADATGGAGLPCVHAWPNDTPFAPDSFEVITLWDTLETFNNPKQVLGELARLLHPGGMMVINHVNLESLDRQLFGKFWCGYELPRHRYLFPSKLLEDLLAEQGMILIKQGCHYGSYSNTISSLIFALEGTLGRNRLINALGRILRSIPCRLLMAPLYYVIDRLGYGSNITMIFRKNPGATAVESMQN